MSVSYTKAQREYAKRHKLSLVTLAFGGFSFQGPIPADDFKLVAEFITEFLKRRRTWLDAKEAPPCS